MRWFIGAAARVGLGAAALAGCSHGATDNVAVGWTSSAPTSMGPCKPLAGRSLGAVQALPTGELLAVQPGDTRLSCRDGDLTLHVMQPTQLSIAPVGRVSKGATFVLSASASADRPLALGDAAVGWVLPAGWRQLEACNHVTGACVKPSSTRVVADAAGSFEMSAQFGALTTTATIVVE